MAKASEESLAEMIEHIQRLFPSRMSVVLMSDGETLSFATNVSTLGVIDMLREILFTLEGLAEDRSHEKLN